MTFQEAIVSFFLSAGLMFAVVFAVWTIGFHLAEYIPTIFIGPIFFGGFYLTIMLVDILRIQ